MKLRPEVRKQAEEKLKRPIPNPDEHEFYRLLEELRAEDPELAALLEEGIQFQTVKPPEEEVKGEVRKRSLMRTLFNRLFMRYDELSGEWVPSRPKQIMVITLGLMGPLVFMWGLNAMSGRPKPKPTPTQTVASAPTQATGGGGELSGAAQAPAPAQGGQTSPASPENASASLLSGDQAAANAPEGRPQGGEAAGVFPEDVPPPPAPPAYSDVPPPPQTATGVGGVPQEAIALPMTAYAPVPATGVQALPMTVYVRPVASTQGQEQSQGSGMAVPVSTQPAQGGGLSVYAGQATAQNQVAPVSSFVAYKPGPASVPPQPAPTEASRPQSQGLPDYFVQNLPEIFGPGASGGASSGGGQRQSPQSSQPSQSSLPYLPGTQVSGRLAVRLIVPEGQEVPVAVEAEDGTTFLGRAKLSPTRRLEITLDQAVAAGKVYSVRAVVLGRDKAQGLPAQVREEAPSLVADLVRGSLRGLSDYVRARSQATTITTTPTGTTIQQGQAPPLELFLGAAAADLFSVPEGTKAVVRVAEVKEGEPLFVLFLGGAQ